MLSYYAAVILVIIATQPSPHLVVYSLAVTLRQKFWTIWHEMFLSKLAEIDQISSQGTIIIGSIYYGTMAKFLNLCQKTKFLKSKSFDFAPIFKIQIVKRVVF